MESDIQNMFQFMLETAMKYPELEMDMYTKKWKKGAEEENEGNMRYYLYCCNIFNMLSAEYERCDAVVAEAAEVIGFNEDQFEMYCGPGLAACHMQIAWQEIVETHRAWYEAMTPRDRSAYGKRFIAHLDAYFRACDRVKVEEEALAAGKTKEEAARLGEEFAAKRRAEEANA